jgi:hypothetical protein
MKLAASSGIIAFLLALSFTQSASATDYVETADPSQTTAVLGAGTGVIELTVNFIVPTPVLLRNDNLFVNVPFATPIDFVHGGLSTLLGGKQFSQRDASGFGQYGNDYMTNITVLKDLGAGQFEYSIDSISADFFTIVYNPKFPPSYFVSGQQTAFLTVPEPESWLLLLLGTTGIGANLRRRRSSLLDISRSGERFNVLRPFSLYSPVRRPPYTRSRPTGQTT